MPGPDSGPDAGPDQLGEGAGGSGDSTTPDPLPDFETVFLSMIEAAPEGGYRFKSSALAQSASGGGGGQLADDLNLDIDRLTLPNTTYYSAGREILSVEIEASGQNVPQVLLNVPIWLAVGPVGSLVAPTITNDNARQAHLRTANGKVYAEIFVGNAAGGTTLARLPLPGDAQGQTYKLWLLVDGNEELWMPVTDFTVY